MPIERITLKGRGSDADDRSMPAELLHAKLPRGTNTAKPESTLCEHAPLEAGKARRTRNGGAKSRFVFMEMRGSADSKFNSEFRLQTSINSDTFARLKTTQHNDPRLPNFIHHKRFRD
jgi:hypothetical protein